MLAQPWWVNLLVLVPILFLILWRRRPLQLAGLSLLYAGIFAAAFGFVEATVVVYLRAILAQASGYGTELAGVARMSAEMTLHPERVAALPTSLLWVEALRESATILMLSSVALLAAARRRERWAVFLWCFALWDLAYYAGLWALLGWPASLRTLDVLFLIPVPWVAEVWFPILVSLLTLTAVVAGRRREAAR